MKGCMTEYKIYIALIFIVAISFPAKSQEKNLIQIKAFDQQVSPVWHIHVAINGKEYISIDDKAGVFYEVPVEDLPPKNIKIQEEALEAESWNYSKGILSIIVRKKSYKNITLTVVAPDHKPLAGLTVTFQGMKPTESVTNAQGIATFPLALHEEMPQAAQFTIAGHKVLQLVSSKDGRMLVVEPLLKKKAAVVDNNSSKDILANFDISQLDSIRSLTVFYAVFKNTEIAALPDDVKRKVDAKFHELVQKLKGEEQHSFIGKISDSSFVRTDVANLLAQARHENELLDDLRLDFEKKIEIINGKLAGGASSLDQSTRDKLLNDLNLLETVLAENEDKFYKNLSAYRIILSSLKSSFFDIQSLEQKLELSESKRMQEQRAFRQKIVIVVSVALVFGILVIFLFYLRMKLEQQKKNLILANEAIRRMNENLEELVSERTRLLINANREMDIFLYRASHDLRTPICSILGLCNIALYSETGELPDLVKKMSGTAMRMDRMLKKLRVINEINQPSNYSSIQFATKVEQLKSEFADMISDRGVDVSFDFPNHLSFCSYPALVDTILYNLFDNAIFFSSIKPNNKPKINVQANMERDRLVIRIRDNGIGIPEDVQLKLWDMFFVGSEHSKGNGLGLYLVSKSIQVLRGTIDIETVPSVYTLFTVTIPVNTERITSLTSEVPKTAMLELA